MNRAITTIGPLAAACALAALFGACGGGNGGNADGGDGSSGDVVGGDTLADQTVGPDATDLFQCDGCSPFPPPGTTLCAPTVLGPSQLVYPLDGQLLPPNMNVLEVQFVPPAGAVEYEVDFENAVTDVRVTTFCNAVPDVRLGPSRGCGLTLPQAAWTDISTLNADGDPLNVTVRATINGSCVSVSPETVRLSFAKDPLAGGIYYWQSATYGGVGGKTGGIYSHDFGTFDPTPTPFYVDNTSGTCVGCHNVSRDGIRMSLAYDDPDGDDEFGDEHGAVLDIPTKTKLGAGTTFGNYPGFQTFTHDHAKMIASTYKTNANAGFAVFDANAVTLLTTSTLPTGMQGTQQDLSKDDSTLVFVVPAANAIPGNNEGDIHMTVGGAIYTSTFTASTNAFGTPQPFLTPTGTQQTFYYPSFSPTVDVASPCTTCGGWVIFNEADDASSANNLDDSFYNRKARVKIMHYPAMTSDTPLDLTAVNVADGLSNSWPRWSPFVGTFHGHNILWITFSSNRDYGLHLTNLGFDNCYPPEGPSYDQPQPLSKQGVTYQDCADPQIWMAAVDIDADRTLDTSDRSFPAFWLPFQDVTAHNHSAQWVEQVSGNPQPDGGTCLPVGDACGGLDGGTGTCCQVCCYGTCAESCVN
jgi:hypothetical protein